MSYNSVYSSNISFCVGVGNKFQDETGDALQTPLRIRFLSTYPSDSRLFEDELTLSLALFPFSEKMPMGDYAIDQKMFRYVFSRTAHYQISRVNHAISTLNLLYKKYGIVEESRKSGLPATMKSISKSRLKRRISRIESEAKEANLECHDILYSVLRKNSNDTEWIAADWGSPDYLGCVCEVLEKANHEIISAAKTISDTQKEIRDQQRLSVAIKSLRLAIFLNIIATLTPASAKESIFDISSGFVKLYLSHFFDLWGNIF